MKHSEFGAFTGIAATMAVFGLTAVLYTQSAPQQTTSMIPATPAGEALRALVASYNTGKHAEARWARWFSIFGPLESVIVERSDPASIKAWLQGRITRRWIGIDLRLDVAKPAAAAHIAVFQLGGALPPELRITPAGALRGEALAREVRTYLDAMCVADYFSGTVVVTAGDKPVVEVACGMASRRYGIPNRVDTRFSIASVGKTFTAVAVLQLVQKGKLALTDRVGTFIPDYPIASMRDATIEQLLTHTSGIGRAERDWIADRIPIPLSTLVEQTTAKPLFPPGTSARYSNEGFLLLGRIVEIAAGEPYAQYVQRQVFDAAGMSGSSFLGWDDETPNVATPYSNFRMTGNGQQQFEPGPRRNALMLHGIRGTPAGGAFSTAPDLAAFARGLRDGRLLDATHAMKLAEPIVRQPPPFRAFSYGVEVAETGGVDYYGKSGGAQGVSANWLTLPSLDMSLVVLSNYDNASDLVLTYLTELVTGTRR
jgi:CubicO group peptidase (beta-lactamase class C family)